MYTRRIMKHDNNQDEFLTSLRATAYAYAYSSSSPHHENNDSEDSEVSTITSTSILHGSISKSPLTLPRKQQQQPHVHVHSHSSSIQRTCTPPFLIRPLTKPSGSISIKTSPVPDTIITAPLPLSPFSTPQSAQTSPSSSPQSTNQLQRTPDRSTTTTTTAPRAQATTQLDTQCSSRQSDRVSRTPSPFLSPSFSFSIPAPPPPPTFIPSLSVRSQSFSLFQPVTQAAIRIVRSATVPATVEPKPRLEFEFEVTPAAPVPVPPVHVHVQSQSGSLSPLSFPEQAQAQFSSPFVLPERAEWFSLNKIHMLEWEAMPWIRGKQPEYLALRDWMFASYHRSPSKYLTFTVCRTFLAADVSHVLSVYEFLNEWKLINAQAKEETRATYGPPLPAVTYAMSIEEAEWPKEAAVMAMAAASATATGTAAAAATAFAIPVQKQGAVTTPLSKSKKLAVQTSPSTPAVLHLPRARFHQAHLPSSSAFNCANSMFTSRLPPPICF